MPLQHRLAGVIAMAFGLAMALGAARPAEAASITVTVSGVISAGSDGAGVFTGVPGASLAGLPARVVQTFAVSPGTVIDAQADYASGFFEVVGLDVTIGGVTQDFASVAGFGAYELCSSAFNLGPSQIAAATSLGLAGGGIVSVFSEVFDTAFELFALPPDIFQDFGFAWPAPATLAGSFLGAAFDATGALAWNFTGSAETFLVRYDPGLPVPAPAALGLLLLGLAGLAATRRRA